MKLPPLFLHVFGLVALLSSSFPSSCDGFEVDIHLEITKLALQSAFATDESTDELLKFQNGAIEQVKHANKKTDKSIEGFLSSHWHFDNELFALASNRLKVKRTQIINNLVPGAGLMPNGEAARTALGQAVHTIQDFYSHTNWVELVNAGTEDGINTDLGTELILNPGNNTVFQPCPDEPDTLEDAGLVSLTSGYFVFPKACFYVPSVAIIAACGALNVCFNYPEGKCRHGFDFFCNGINKDDQGNPSQAFGLALDATSAFVNDILEELDGRTNAIKALMGIQGPTLAIAIDTTGSMSVVADVQRTFDADEYLTFVNAPLFASGGGDCPERSMTALTNAIAASSSNSQVILITDADAKNPEEADTVIASATRKGIQILFVLTEYCSSTPDPVYERIATSTAGQLFLLSQSEVSGLFDAIRPRLSTSGSAEGVAISTLFRASGDIAASPEGRVLRPQSDGRDVGTSTSFPFPIDRTVSSLSISVAFSGGSASISLVRPDGSTVLSSDPLVTITELSQGSFIRIEGPETGNWEICITGTGSFDLDMTVASPVQLTNAGIVELRFVYDGFAFLPISGQPLLGSGEVIGLATLEGTFAMADFFLVDQSGNTLLELDLALGAEFSADGEFIGVFDLPDEPFRFAVSGETTEGDSFLRHFPALIRPQPAAVVYNVSASTNFRGYLPFNDTTVLTFSVTNSGDVERTFRVMATDELSYIQGVSPGILVLGPGEMSDVQLELETPFTSLEECEQELEDLITVTVTDSSDGAAAANNVDLTVFTDCEVVLVERNLLFVGPDGAGTGSKKSKRGTGSEKKPKSSKKKDGTGSEMKPKSQKSGSGAKTPKSSKSG